jgi:hypothetical protein
MMPRFGSAKYVGEGLGQLATGVVIGRQNRKLNEAESAGRKSADDLFSRLFGTANSARSPEVRGPLSVLGVAPEGASLPAPDPNSPHALGDAAMAALGKPRMETGADAASIKAGLVARGLPEHIADGFMMNFDDESGMDPGINEANPVVPGSRGGFGLYQLTGSRRHAYEAFAAERGVPFDDVDAQLDFLMAELQGTEAAAWEKISRTQDAGQAGAAIVNHFLRPAEEHRASRTARYTGGQGYTADNYGGPQGGIPMAELQLALQNPWLSGDQKAMIAGMIEQQTQAADPMRALELEKAQIELEALRSPGVSQDAYTDGAPAGTMWIDPNDRTAGVKDIPGYRGPADKDPLEALKARAKEGGLVEGTDAYRNFMINNGPANGMIIESTPDGGLRVVQGDAVAGAKPLTEGQSKDVVYATRAEGALATLDPIAGALTSRSAVAADWLPMGLGGGMQTDDYQIAKTAGDEFLQAILRKDTGAAITSQEQVLYGETYLPRPGDSEARLQYKAEARKRAVEALKGGMSASAIVAQEKALERSGGIPQAERYGKPPAGGGNMDFSKMGIPEIGQVDIGSLTPEQMDALEKRMTELGL